MSSCCSIDPNADVEPCPQCGETGPVVGHKPVLPHRHDATEGGWQYCPTDGCPVVYYLGPDIVAATELRTRVANKGLDKPTPVCFCFSHTTDDLAEDLEANDGTSSIKAAIKEAVAEGFCACEHLNPSQQCCLADVHRTLKSITTAGASTLA